MSNLAFSCQGCNGHKHTGPPWAVDLIDRADVDTLDRWTYRVLDATVLEAVFQDAD